MKEMTEPQKAVPLPERNSCILYMPDGQGGQEPSEYHVRGAIAWPLPDPDAGFALVGHAIILAMDVEDKNVYIFDEMSFRSIDHVLDADHQIRHEGLCTWIDKAWVTYGCQTYYFHQPDATHSRWRQQVRDSKAIGKQPEFIEVNWDEGIQAENTIWEYLGKGQLKYWADEGVHKAIARRKTGDTIIIPVLHALMVGLNGMDLYAWRKPTDPITGHVRPFPRNPFVRRLQHLSG